jgi:hypothetical protein
MNAPIEHRTDDDVVYVGKDLKSFFSRSLPDKHSNFRWTCTFAGCQASGTNSTRMADHARVSHPKEMGYAIELWEKNNTRSGKRKVAAEKESQQQNKLQKLNIASDMTLNKYAAQAIISCALPLGFFDNPAIKKVINEAIKLGRKEPNMHVEIQSRRVMSTKWVPQEARCLFEASLKVMLPRGKQFGATLCQDGRSNVRTSSFMKCFVTHLLTRLQILHDPLLVFGVEVQGRYLFLGTVNAGANKKTSEFLTEIATKFIGDESCHAGFGPSIVAYCVDGAPCCLNNAAELQERYSIVAVRCQLHAISVVIKRMFKLAYVDNIFRQATSVTDLFLSNSRLRSLLKTLSNNK